MTEPNKPLRQDSHLFVAFLEASRGAKNQEAMNALRHALTGLVTGDAATACLAIEEALTLLRKDVTAIEDPEELLLLVHLKSISGETRLIRRLEEALALLREKPERINLNNVVALLRQNGVEF